jgi:hypothetical protein
MSEGITGAGNTVINNYYSGEQDDAADTSNDNSTSGASSEGSSIADLLADFAKTAAADGKIDESEAKALKALTDAAAQAGGSEGAESTDEASGDAGGDDTTSEDAGGPTPQEFMSQLNDIADEKKGLTDGEEKMLEAGKGLVNATPEERQKFLDKAKELADANGGEIGDKEAAELEGFAEGMKAGESGSEEAKTEDGEKPFMDQVEDVLNQTGADGPGEKMARDAAQMLKDNPEEDQKAFLDELQKLMDNKDGNGDAAKDIDETNDGEGTMLKKMAEAFDEIDRSGGSDSSSSDAKDSSSADSASSGNKALTDLIANFTGEDSNGGKEISDSELSALRAVIDATKPETAEAS